MFKSINYGHVCTVCRVHCAVYTTFMLGVGSKLSELPWVKLRKERVLHTVTGWGEEGSY